MKQICFSIIGEYEWSKRHGEESKHPQERLKELGIKEIISIPESIADCWNCLVEDFDFELPDYISIHDICWEYFYHYRPNACKEAMIKCGIDYKSIEDKYEAEKQKEQERINNNKKLFGKFTIKSIEKVTAYNEGDDLLFSIATPDKDKVLFTLTIPDED